MVAASVVLLGVVVWISLRTDESDRGELTPSQYDEAVAVVRHRVAMSRDASVTSAYAYVRSSNAGMRDVGCPRRVIHVTVAGDFPHTMVLPAVGQSATVTALTMDLDPATGRMCQAGTLTTLPPPTPDGAADLLPQLDR